MSMITWSYHVTVTLTVFWVGWLYFNIIVLQILANNSTPLRYPKKKLGIRLLLGYESWAELGVITQLEWYSNGNLKILAFTIPRDSKASVVQLHFFNQGQILWLGIKDPKNMIQPATISLLRVAELRCAGGRMSNLFQVISSWLWFSDKSHLIQDLSKSYMCEHI